ncbi:MAG: hypothetical protein SV062_06570 [Thermodesulfobacteriota bacterium]|nr:hypothetical protein [Thermodesulfobacteriota bacterium]
MGKFFKRGKFVKQFFISVYKVIAGDTTGNDASIFNSIKLGGLILISPIIF